MTEEQLTVIRRILEDYDKFAATASERYPLRGCYSEWGKQPYGVLSPSPNLPLKERWGVSPVATGDQRLLHASL